MVYSNIEVKTKDGLNLTGRLVESDNKNSILISVHGTASNFYEENFINVLYERLPKNGTSVLSTNNRGAKKGASKEYFEDCLLDIDAWIKIALNRGYKQIFLQGHSFGTEKIVYYMGRGSYSDKIKGLILLGFSDSVGSQLKYSPHERLLKEARALVKAGKGSELLSDPLALCGEMPCSSGTYVNFFERDSELSKVFPFHKKGSLPLYRKINLPILALIGDKKEYTVIPIKNAIDILKRENPQTRAYQIKNCNHDFEGKEIELTKKVQKFIEEVYH